MEDIELQLLVIDLGNSCAVKVEKGEKPFDRYGDGGVYFPPIHNIPGESGEPLITGNNWMDTRPFIDIRAAIDALEEKPPYPHLVKLDNSDDYAIIWGEPATAIDTVEKDVYNFFSNLAGKSLPIWTPTQGEWKCLLQVGMWPMPTDVDVKIWRYTRRKA